jgi:hypothetical protein
MPDGVVDKRNMHTSSLMVSIKNISRLLHGYNYATNNFSTSTMDRTLLLTK